MCLIFLAEDESELFYVCCGSIHAYAALIVFSMFDFLAVIITLLTYAYFAKSNSFHWTNIGPICALILSLSVYPIGPLGLFQQSARKISIYKWRLRCIVLFSIIWMLLCLFLQEDKIGILVAIIWLLAAILYILGASICSNALEYLDSYRGYDGSDPAVMEEVLTKKQTTTKTVAN